MFFSSTFVERNELLQAPKRAGAQRFVLPGQRNAGGQIPLGAGEVPAAGDHLFVPFGVEPGQERGRGGELPLVDGHTDRHGVRIYAGEGTEDLCVEASARLGGEPQPPAGLDEHEPGVLAFGGEFTKAANSVTVTLRYGAAQGGTTDFVCSLYADATGSRTAPDGCPDCTWSFTTAVTSGGEEGASCGDFVSDPTFLDYTYDQLYFANYWDGFGWSDYYSGVEDLVFVHLNGADYEGWYAYAYNDLAAGTYNVDGDSKAAKFAVLDFGDYYEFYY